MISIGHVSRVLRKSVLKTCPTPDLGKSGTVKELKSVYVPGDSISIICNEGFDLDGPSQVTCGPGGQWQGLPKCRPKRISSPGRCINLSKLFQTVVYIVRPTFF